MHAKNQQILGQQLDWQEAKLGSVHELADNELHLWLVPLRLEANQTESALNLLNDIQRDKYFRRMTTQLQMAYLAGRYYLFRLLSAYAELPATELKLSLTRLNKPYLNPNPTDIQFNFSDCPAEAGHIGLYVFCRNRAVGADIEPLSRQGDYSAIAKRRLSDAELAFARNPQGGVDVQRFLACWTRKEAFGKATGQGINFPMREMDLTLADDFALEFYDQESPPNAFRLQQVQIDNRFIAAVVHKSHQALQIKAFRPAD